MVLSLGDSPSHQQQSKTIQKVARPHHPHPRSPWRLRRPSAPPSRDHSPASAQTTDPQFCEVFEFRGTLLELTSRPLQLKAMDKDRWSRVSRALVCAGLGVRACERPSA